MTRSDKFIKKFLQQLSQNIYNNIDYPLRQAFKWKRKKLEINNEPKDNMFRGIPEKVKPGAYKEAERILSSYGLEKFHDKSTVQNYRLGLYYLDLLEQAFEKGSLTLPDNFRVADIGTSTWFYVQALYSFLKLWRNDSGRQLSLEGYEIDAYRIYADFYSRYNHAIANIGELTDVTYIPKGFEKQEKTFDLITMFFPFMFLDEHLEWGLPSNVFSPGKLFEDVALSLKDGGILFIVNQGEAEHEAQEAMMKEFNIPIITSYRHDSRLYNYSPEHFVIIGRK